LENTRSSAASLDEEWRAAHQSKHGVQQFFSTSLKSHRFRHRPPLGQAVQQVVQALGARGLDEVKVKPSFHGPFSIFLLAIARQLMPVIEEYAGAAA
jgi:hypothetical protein